MARGRIAESALPVIDFDALPDAVMVEPTVTRRGRTAADFHPWVRANVAAALASNPKAAEVPVPSEEKGIRLGQICRAYGRAQTPELTVSTKLVDTPSGPVAHITAKIREKRVPSANGAPAPDADYRHGRNATTNG